MRERFIRGSCHNERANSQIIDRPIHTSLSVLPFLLLAPSLVSCCFRHLTSLLSFWNALSIIENNWTLTVMHKKCSAWNHISYWDNVPTDTSRCSSAQLDVDITAKSQQVHIELGWSNYYIQGEDYGFLCRHVFLCLGMPCMLPPKENFKISLYLLHGKMIILNFACLHSCVSSTVAQCV